MFNSHMEENDLQETVLKESSIYINKFIDYCRKKGIIITKANFIFEHRIGIVVTYPDIALKLNPNLESDSEGLSKLSESTNFSSNFTFLYSSFFRRGFSPNYNYTPNFISNFINQKDPEINAKVLIDSNRVKVETGGPDYF